MRGSRVFSILAADSITRHLPGVDRLASLRAAGTRWASAIPQPADSELLQVRAFPKLPNLLFPPCLEVMASCIHASTLSLAHNFQFFVFLRRTAKLSALVIFNIKLRPLARDHTSIMLNSELSLQIT